MKNTIQIRLEIIRNLRADKLQMLDHNINLLEDSGEDATELRQHRQRLRHVTEPYKALLDQEGEIQADDSNPALSPQWDAFTSVDWN